MKSHLKSQAKAKTQGNVEALRISEIKNLLIITAMEVEAEALLKRCPRHEVMISAGLKLLLHEFQSPGRTVRVLKSGVGSVNAGACLALALERYSIDAIILLGVGGALVPSLSPGDLVISDRVIQHDAVYSGEAGSELMAPGQLFVSLPPEERFAPPLDAHPSLVDWLRREWPESRVGTVLSGSEFVASGERKRELARAFPDALLVEMEAAGVGQIASAYGIPFVVSKTVADRLRPEGTVAGDYQRFLSAASSRAAEMIQFVLGAGPTEDPAPGTLL